MTLPINECAHYKYHPSAFDTIKRKPPIKLLAEMSPELLKFSHKQIGQTLLFNGDKFLFDRFVSRTNTGEMLLTLVPTGRDDAATDATAILKGAWQVPIEHPLWRDDCWPTPRT